MESIFKKIGKDYDVKKLHQIVINHFKPKSGMDKLVDKLRKKYKVGMLTNQTEWLDEINSIYNFYPKFAPLINSKNVGYKKPEEKIFRILIKKANCLPEEIVFIDNDAEYGKPSRKLRIKFIHFQNQKQLERKFRELGVEL